LIRHALILTAGLGTRLRPLTNERAKPAMPVAGDPLIRRIVAGLTAYGLTELVMNLHHRPETLTAVVGDASDLGARLRYSWEQPKLLGSAGGPRKALPILGAETFFLVNGDTLTDVSLADLEAAHDAAHADVTLALVPNRDFEHYGGVKVDDRGRVIGFTRKGPASRDTWHFVGVQVVSASVFAPLPEDEPLDTIGGVYDALIRDRPGSVRAFCTDARFWDIGTAGDYLRTAQTFSAFSRGGSDVGQRVKIDPSARVTGSILWDDVEVGPNASLDACIAADGVRVPAGAAYRHSILIQHEDGLAVTSFDP
jgi:NDP-sugar pyrophosphorylase family protein